MNYFYIVILILLIVISIPYITRTLLWNGALEALQNNNDAKFIRIVTGKPYILFFGKFQSAFNLLRLYIMRTDTRKAKEQTEKLLAMNLDKKQERDVLSAAFYFFIERKNRDFSKQLLDRLKTTVSQEEYEYDHMLYDVMVENSSSWIPYVQEKLRQKEEEQEKKKKDQTDLDSQTGVLHYLLALQYKAQGKKADFQKERAAAKKLLSGTPWEKKVKEL